MTHAWHLEPFDFQVFFALAALVSDGESVRLVAGVLQKFKCRAGAVQDDALAVVGEYDFFEALGKSDER